MWKKGIGCLFALGVALIISNLAFAHYEMVKEFHEQESRLIIEEVTPTAELPDEDKEIKDTEKLAPPPIEKIFSIPEIKIEEEKVPEVEGEPFKEEQFVKPEEISPPIKEEKLIEPEHKILEEEEVFIEPERESFPVFEEPPVEEEVILEPERKISPEEEEILPIPEIPEIEEEKLEGLEKKDTDQIEEVKNNGYLLGIDDVITVSVMRHNEFSGKFLIEPHGYISLPYLDPIKAEGLTKYQLRDKLIETLSDYIESPTVDVRIDEYNSQAVYVVGAVARPGKYSTRGKKMTVRDAIIAAGMPTRGASLRYAYVFSSEPGKPRRDIRLYDIIYRGRTEYDIELELGDVVYVRSTVISKLGIFLDQLLNPLQRATAIKYIEEAY